MTFSLGLIDGLGFDVWYVTKKHIHLKFGANIGKNGFAKKGTDYTGTISVNEFQRRYKTSLLIIG